METSIWEHMWTGPGVLVEHWSILLRSQVDWSPEGSARARAAGIRRQGWSQSTCSRGREGNKRARMAPRGAERRLDGQRTHPDRRIPERRSTQSEDKNTRFVLKFSVTCVYIRGRVYLPVSRRVFTTILWSFGHLHKKASVILQDNWVDLFVLAPFRRVIFEAKLLSDIELDSQHHFIQLMKWARRGPHRLPSPFRWHCCLIVGAAWCTRSHGTLNSLRINETVAAKQMN